MPILSFDQLQKITGPIKPGSAQEQNAKSLLLAVNAYGFAVGLNIPVRLAYFLGQLLHESAAFKYDRELWGPTPAQVRYDTRADLGNTAAKDGDGFRYRGRGPIQITGKHNYRSFTAWARKLDPNAPDFVATPDAVNRDPWEGLGPIWFWSTRKLNGHADQGDLRRITKRINGGYNGLTDRKRWTLRAHLVLLGYHPHDLKGFQRAAGLTIDGIQGPKTRAALHRAICALPPITPPKSNPNLQKENTMQDVKGFLKSKTIWGAALAVAPSVAGLFGYTITGADVTAATSAANDIVTAIGSLLAIYGRVTARKRIGKLMD